MELISAMTSVPSRGASREAERAMSPSHKNTGTAEQSTPTPKVDDRFGKENGMVPLQAAVQRTHNGHGSHGKDHGTVDKAVGEPPPAAGFPLQPIAQADHRTVQVQKLAQQGPQHHGENGDQGLLRVINAGNGNADDHKGQSAHQRFLQPIRQESACKQAHKATGCDGGPIDRRT